MKRREFIRIGSGVAGATMCGGLTSDWFGLYGNPLPDPDTNGDRVVPSFCELCFWKCGILAHVKNGRVTKIKGNPKDPLSNGRLCPRGAGGTGDDIEKNEQDERRRKSGDERLLQVQYRVRDSGNPAHDRIL